MLGGVRVLDLSQALAGPYATALLADMGADVIKVEPPSGDHFRPLGGGAIFATVNRNKRGIVLDLKTDKDRDALLRLAATADVFVESFVPGVAERLGCGYDAIRAVKPDVVYVSISGFGQTGPYREQPGYDVVGQAMSGIMAATGEADGPPVRVGASLIDVSTGLYAAVGILAALRDGGPHHIDLSLVEVAVSLVPHFFAHYSMDGTVRRRQGSAADLGCPYQNLQTADGFVFVGCTTDKHFRALCAELGLDALPDDPRYDTAARRLQHRDALIAELEPVFKAMTTREAVDAVWRARVPGAPVLTVPEVLEDPHLRERGIWTEVDGIVFPRNALRVDGRWFGVRSAAPALGQDTSDLVGE